MSYVINSIGYTPGSTNIAGWKMDPLIEDVYPMEKKGIFQQSPCYVISKMLQISPNMVYLPTFTININHSCR